MTLYAEVNCLAVEGNAAIVGGEVTHASVARYVGKQVLLFVEDSERSRGRDRSSGRPIAIRSRARTPSR